MTLKQMKEATLKLIEEYDETELTLDEDIKTKLNSSINIVMFECSRMKKIYGKTSLSVLEDDEVTFSDIDEQMYQLEMIRDKMNEWMMIDSAGTPIGTNPDTPGEINPPSPPVFQNIYKSGA